MNYNCIPLVTLLTVCAYSTTSVADVLSSATTTELVEPAATYDSEASMLNMRVKTVIQAGSCLTGDYTGCTLNDVLDDVDGSDDFKPEIRVHMTADNYPDDGLVSNAEMHQQSATSRNVPQKSFRVKLDKTVGLWSGEGIIQLEKGFWDFSRIRNKLSHDLFIDIPNLPSMRSQFINFKVEDQGPEDDYGLYTQVEHFGEAYLTRRGWDKDSRVYKAKDFYFKTDPAFALNAAGVPLDKDAFGKKVEINAGNDHSNFANMLRDLNNPALNFNTEVFDKYFNKDNYLTWLSVNILLGNADTDTRNFYLYNPKGSEKFYFVPSDYSTALGSQGDNQPRSALSHANWWNQQIHKQFLRQPGNLDLLRKAVEEIKAKYLTREALQQKADSYYDLVFPLISTAPDIDDLYLGGSTSEKIAAYNLLFTSLADQVAVNYDQFVSKIGDPMLFWMYQPTATNDDYQFTWTRSESLIGQAIAYDFEISTSVRFEADSIVVSRKGLQATSVTIPWNYASGNYFSRVIARDVNAPEQYWQAAINSVQTSSGEVYGVIAFNATIDNSNDDVVGNPDNVSTSQNSAITIDVLANDIGTGLEIVSSNPWSQKGGTVAIADNKINYKPRNGFLGVDKLWYVLKNAQGRSNFSEVTITVSAVSSANPVGTPDSVSTSSNTPVIIDVLANDIGAGLTLVSSNPWSSKGGNVSVANERIVYSPKQDFIGEDKLWYVFQDSQGRTNYSEVVINVTGTAEYPVAISDDITTALNTVIFFDALANDTGVGLQITEVNDYSVNGGRVAIVDGGLRYTPKPNYIGADSFWYSIADSLGRTNAVEVTVTVTGNGTGITDATHLLMQVDFLKKQRFVWGEAGGTKNMKAAQASSAGSFQLKVSNDPNLLDNQLITYLSTDGQYYTVATSQSSGDTINLKTALPAPIAEGGDVWNFYKNASHPNTIGYRSLADFALRNADTAELNTGKHVLLGDSWFSSFGIRERLAEKLPNAQFINLGVGGDTAADLLGRFDSQVAPQSPDVVWLIAGTNDYYQDVSVEAYISNMEKIIVKINAMGAKAMVFDSSIAPSNSGSDALTEKSRQYADALAELLN